MHRCPQTPLPPQLPTQPRSPSRNIYARLKLDPAPHVAPPRVDPGLLAGARADLPVTVELGQHGLAAGLVFGCWRVRGRREAGEARLALRFEVGVVCRLALVQAPRARGVGGRGVPASDVWRQRIDARCRGKTRRRCTRSAGHGHAESTRRASAVAQREGWRSPSSHFGGAHAATTLRRVLRFSPPLARQHSPKNGGSSCPPARGAW